MRAIPIFLGSVVLMLSVLLPLRAAAQGWRPELNIELIAPSAAGGGSDTLARLVQRLLQGNKLVETPLTVVNKPGAGGAIAWTALSQSPGDGHHVAISTANLLTNHITGRSPLNYTDFTPLAQLFSESVGVAVRADSPIKSGKDLFEKLRADSGALSAAIGTSLGNSGHIALALAAKAAGGDARKLKAVVFPAAAQGMTALLGGHVELIASPVSNLAPQHQEGKIRILAVSAPRRLSGPLSSVPAWRELAANVVIDNLRGVLGPKGMGTAPTAWWEGTLARMSATDDWKTHLERNNWTNSFAGAEAGRKILQQQYDEMRAGLAELGLAKR